MAIYVTGDTHGTYDIKKIHKWYNKNINNISTEDFLIQLGDWGGIWYNKNDNRNYLKDLLLQKKWSKKKFTTLIVPGNHENYNIINSLPVIEKYGGKVRELKIYNPFNKNKTYKSIYLLERGEIYTINNKKILVVGGAQSNDKMNRIENIDWWKEELLSINEENNCLKNLDLHNWKVDLVLTHTCPTSIVKNIINNQLRDNIYCRMEDPTSKFFQFLLDEGMQFKEWHFGHFHIDYCFKNFFCHYNNSPMKIN